MKNATAATARKTSTLKAIWPARERFFLAALFLTGRMTGFLAPLPSGVSRFGMFFASSVHCSVARQIQRAAAFEQRHQPLVGGRRAQAQYHVALGMRAHVHRHAHLALQPLLQAGQQRPAA